MDVISEFFSEYDGLGAFRQTIYLTLVSALLALVIGTVVAVMRVSPIRVLQLIGTAYVNIVRNTPLTLVIVFCNLGLFLQLGISLADQNSPTSIDDNNFRLAVLGLSVYHAAFVAEAIRSGVNTVPLGQAEAARAIGLPFLKTLRYVVLPQAFRGAIAPLGNVLIALTKNSTVASVIGVTEASAVMKVMMENRPDVIFVVFGIFAVGFVILTLPVGILFTSLSKRLAVKR
ncbi:glutamate ABC transporter permease [Kribbella sp. ALI-6-A]|jgi:glutamate transport system permease protein|uniref:amino acid ABC transporter permease n=1 Tax=Kribbella sp. ALI-6-A TaxID=1933817 RepID=UPI00097C553F|nr:amino acid ABC transporter permease [Kribbella sp. ALI-6-A]ONI77453.1 glutamate ABC transporter permease [Kribbella sp. ALI-6-A]